MNKSCGTAGKPRRKCGTRVVLIFKGFLPFLEFDMRSRGIRLAKEDSMVVEGPILTANSHGDKFLCNSQVEEKFPYAIYFTSKNLLDAELNYIVTEKELLAIVFSLETFRHYITSYQTFMHTDHDAIKYLMNKPDVNARIIRWLLLLQQFDLTIVDKPGKENVGVDFLSRMNLPASEEAIIDYQLSYEHLFDISVLSPWFVDIENYFVSAQFPPNPPSREKSKIIRKSSPFTWIGGNLFKLGPN